jgi:hypothetical protein
MALWTACSSSGRTCQRCACTQERCCRPPRPTCLGTQAIPICYTTHGTRRAAMAAIVNPPRVAAIGTVRFGLDGSLVLSAGEGAHWDMSNEGVCLQRDAASHTRLARRAILRRTALTHAELAGDFGQSSELFGKYDWICHRMFGDEQAIGQMRSQVLYSYGGKVLRIRPDNGDGICPGDPDFPVPNPFCTASGMAQTVPAKVWSLGHRQPWRINVRPTLPGEKYDGGPGVIYVAEGAPADSARRACDPRHSHDDPPARKLARVDTKKSTQSRTPGRTLAGRAGRVRPARRCAHTAGPHDRARPWLAQARYRTRRPRRLSTSTTSR